MPSKTGIVWEGAKALRRELCPVGELKTHPDNPWRGNIDEIAASLKRFGQVRTILVDPEGVIVAGNHTYLAAVELGWTHVAAIPNEFATADEARAYLLADNHLAELGTYERTVLMNELAALEKAGAWEGTGYQPRDLQDMRALEAMRDKPPELPPQPSGEPRPVPELREIVLMFEGTKLEAFSGHLRILWKEYGTEGTTETVLRAVREEAIRLNTAAGEAA